MYVSSTGWKELALDLQGDKENPQELSVPKESYEGSEENKTSSLWSFRTASCTPVLRGLEGKGHYYHLCPLIFWL